jgi:hypothetical protein
MLAPPQHTFELLTAYLETSTFDIPLPSLYLYTLRMLMNHNS